MPTDRNDPLSELSGLERLHVRIARRMNREPWKAFWTACGRQLNARVVATLSFRQLVVHGFENIEGTSVERPVLLIANHRSYFDMHLVSGLLFRRLRRRMRLFFPIRGRYYYESVGGIALNLVGAYWSMYPPLFASADHQAFDRYALEVLIGLCRDGRGHVIGIHPEGGRNKSPDPYSFRKIQPGAGRIIHAARPQVVPVFIAGLGNRLSRIVANNWRAAEPIRVHFGPAVDLSEFYAMPAKGSTYKAITEHAMNRVRELADHDREIYAAQPLVNAERDSA